MPDFTPAEWKEIAVWLLAIGVLLVLCIFKVRRKFQQKYDSWKAAADFLENAPQKGEQVWRKPTDIRLIEDLRKAVEQIEKQWASDREKVSNFLLVRQWPASRSMSRFILRAPSAPIVDESLLKEYEELCAKLDRLWSGKHIALDISDLDVQIEKLALQNDTKPREYKIELERHRRDLTRFSDLLKLEGTKAKRRIDVQHEVFEKYGIKIEEIIQTEKQYNEGIERIRASGLDKKTQARLLEMLKKMHEQQISEADLEDDIPLYGKEKKG